MTLIRKLKTYFINNDFYSWRHFQSNQYELKFDRLTDEILLDMGVYIKSTLESSDEIGNVRHRLHEKTGRKCADLDQLLPFLQKIIDGDYQETCAESQAYNWEFTYFVARHERCENTIQIRNGLRTRDSKGNCIYQLATVRKFDGNYYCWNHAD